MIRDDRARKGKNLGARAIKVATTISRALSENSCHEVPRARVTPHLIARRGEPEGRLFIIGVTPRRRGKKI
jgi:hypothetical protein